MKIEIDLNDIFHDEHGVPDETVEESVLRQVMDKLSGDLRKRLFDRLDSQLSAALNEQLTLAVKERLPALLDDLMNAEYVPTDRYGDRSKPTTFRAQLIKTIAEQCVYKPSTVGYHSEENAFTKTMRSVIDAQFADVKTALVAQIDGEFKKNALTYAVKALSDKLGLSK